MNTRNYILCGLVVLGIVSLPLVTYFLNFPGDFSQSNSDWGDFGSYIGGTVGALLSGLGFIILSVTLVITITHNYSERESSREANELAKASYEAQIIHQKNEFNLQLINSYIDALNVQIGRRTFPELKTSDNDEFLNKALYWLKHFVSVNPNSDVFSLASSSLNQLHIRYDNECITLCAIEKIIIEESNEEIKHHFKSQLYSKVNPENVFWIQMHLCLCSKGYKDKIIEHRLFNPTARLIDVFPDHYKRKVE
ncbi:hypothetical protein [Vibrio alginolyticus]|uniref:hypothetical protein n=1 Tax=Vibrio alginolyticus TaxID=663 RepID=UPI003D7C6001